MICWKCRKEISFGKPVRGDECPLCHADLYVCKACDFYENGFHNDCREASAEFVSDKERSNFCDYFRVRKAFKNKLNNDNRDASAEALNAYSMFGLDTDIPSGKSKADDARDAFNALFS